MRTLEEVIAAQSPESQAIIKAMADKMRLEIGVKTMNTVQIPTGTIKTFGLLGIPYEVGEQPRNYPMVIFLSTLYWFRQVRKSCTNFQNYYKILMQSKLCTQYHLI